MIMLRFKQVGFVFVCLMTYNLLFSQQLVINEFMSKNNSTLEDEFGDYSDWIEIFNPTQDTIHLLNWHLSDDEDELNKWTFPNLIIESGGFVLVFASGKNIYTPNGVHTNFKIGASGEALFLCNSSGQIVDQTVEVELEGDQSYGRISDGNSPFAKFYTSSPNSSNVANVVLNELQISHVSGFYDTPILLSVNSFLLGEDVHYTLDGSCPTPASPILEDILSFEPGVPTAIDISQIPTTPLEGPWPLPRFIWKQPDTDMLMANVIRYRSFSEAQPSSKIYSGFYLIQDSILSRFNLPVISILSDSANFFNYDTGIYIPGKRYDEMGWDWWPDGNYRMRGSEWERFAHIDVFEPDGENVLLQDCGIRIFGGWSSVMPQKSIRIIADRNYGSNRFEYPFFPDLPMDKYKQVVLRNSGNDFVKSHFRDAFMQSLLTGLDMELQAYQPFVVFINGNYWGLHNMREKIDETYFERRFGIEEDDLMIVSACGFPEINSNQDYVDMIAYIETNSMAIQGNYEYIKTRMDVVNFVDYNIAEIFFGNTDWPANNNKAWKTTNPNSKWRWFIYDLDFGFGAGEDYTYNSLEYALAVNSPNYSNPDCATFLLRSLLENETFKTLFIDRFAWHLNNTFREDVVIDKIDDFISQLEEEMYFHIQRWHYPQTYSDWLSETDYMKEFAANRPCVCVEHLMEKFDLEEFDFDCSGVGFADDLQSTPISIFPNPSKGIFYLKNSKHKNNRTTIWLTNAFGTSIRKFQFDFGAFETKRINVDGLGKGLYFVSISTNSESYTLKMIVQ